MLLLIQAALGAEVVNSAGAELTINDPFTLTYGMRLGAEVEVLPWIAVGVLGGMYPSLGDANLTPLTNQLYSQLQVSPDTTTLRWRAVAEARLTPLSVTAHGWTRRVSAHVGLGVIHTIDDDNVYGDDPQFLSTQEQTHPMTSMGLSGELQRQRLGVRLRIERSAYVEEIMGTTDYDRRHGWVGVEMTVRRP
jgi:hypothetical protein